MPALFTTMLASLAVWARSAAACGFASSKASGTSPVLCHVVVPILGDRRDLPPAG